MADGKDAGDIGLSAGPGLERGVVRLNVHGQSRALVIKARMHLAADGAAMGPDYPVYGQEARIGVQFGQVFGNGQGVPDLGALVLQARHQHRGLQKQQCSGPVGGILYGDGFNVDVEAGHLAEQP